MDIPQHVDSSVEQLIKLVENTDGTTEDALILTLLTAISRLSHVNPEDDVYLALIYVYRRVVGHFRPDIAIRVK